MAALRKMPHKQPTGRVSQERSCESHDHTSPGISLQGTRTGQEPAHPQTSVPMLPLPPPHGETDAEHPLDRQAAMCAHLGGLDPWSDRMDNRLGGKALCVSWRELQTGQVGIWLSGSGDLFRWGLVKWGSGGKTHPGCGRHVPMSWGPRLNEKQKVS